MHLLSTIFRAPLAPLVAIVLGITLSHSTASAQYYQRPLPELSIGIGATNFLGDLGGRDQFGSDFIWDLELSQTSPAVKISYMHFVNNWSGIRYNFAWGQIAGDDALTAETFRSNRNLHFRSSIIEMSAVYEIHIFKEKATTRYSLRDQRMRLIGMKGGQMGTYIFAGLGTAYTNPKAQLDGSGAWIALAPLGTEGQGLPGGPDPYNRFALAFPMGFGFRFARNRNLTISLELGYRITTSDYLDDVSTDYYDNQTLQNIRGDLAASLANPSSGPSTWTQAGEQRGDPTDNDGYMFLTINGHYKFHTKNNRRKNKRRRYRARVNQSFRW